MKIYRQALMAVTIGAACWFAATPSNAAVLNNNGQIDTIDAAQGTNFAYRVTFAGVTTMCAGGSNFAYTNVADDNYKGYVATLLAAFSMGKQVSLAMELVGGQCHILEVNIR